MMADVNLNFSGDYKTCDIDEINTDVEQYLYDLENIMGETVEVQVIIKVKDSSDD
jgi:hypothetical protein